MSNVFCALAFRVPPDFWPSPQSIRTEYSYKYRRRDLRDFAEAAGFAVERFWTDEREYFSVHYLTVA
jgi:uncharacterized SAM-dependent methyltransferase